MNGVLKAVALGSMLFVGPGVERQEPASYLCIPDLSTGFVKKDGSWERANFNVEGKKYLLARRDDRWSFSNFGEQASPLDTCTETATDSLPYFKCGFSMAFGETTVNIKSLRYQKYFAGDFVLEKPGSNDDANTPYIEIGKCSRL
jgi:hypothetical protein